EASVTVSPIFTSESVLMLFAILEIPLISLFEKLALPLPLSAAFLGHNLTLAIAILIVLLWNFLANRYWTYNDVSK
ncbi:MAG TPA: hypothetical protein PKO03_05215, partial [Anaerolineaceae bacterium]|nr:hypothetical protein [Anaerolineaceae bacterium]